MIEQRILLTIYSVFGDGDFKRLFYLRMRTGGDEPL
jgi:hypothetical protein